MPCGTRSKGKAAAKAQPPKQKKEEKEEEEEEKVEEKAEASEAEESSSSGSVKQTTPKKRTRAAAKGKAAAAAAPEDDSEEEDAEEEEEKPAAKKAKRGGRKATSTSSSSRATKKKTKDEEDEDEEESGEAEGGPVQVPGAGGERPEDCDAFWADGDEADIDDPHDNDFAWPPKKQGQLKIVSWNVAGFKAVLKKGFKEYLAREDADVVCLQETKIAPSAVRAEDTPGYHATFYECAKSAGNHGTALLSKQKPLSVAKGLGVAKLDTEGRVITAEFDAFYVVSCYVPNSSRGLVHWPLRKEWDAAFLEHMKKLDASKPVIYCGDLNVAHLWIDLANPKTNLNRTAGFLYGERDNFTTLLKAGFADVYRHHYPKRRKFYTFWTYMGGARAKNIGWRLDYFVVSQRLLPKVTQIWRRPKVQGSDHCPLCITVEP